MASLRTGTCFGLGFLLLASAARADEVRLQDGRVLVGKVRQQGDRVTVETLDGAVEVSATEIVTRRTDAELRSELARLARARDGDTAFDHLILAQTALRFGLEREMWREFDQVVSDEARPASLQPAIERFMADLEPVLLAPAERQAAPSERARALIRQVKPGVGPGQREAVRAHLRGLDGVEDELLAQAHRGVRPDHRQTARIALADRGDDASFAYLYRATVVGKTRADREAAAELLVERDAARTASDYLVPALLHDNPDVRIHTAQALARLAVPEVAVPALVHAGPLAGTPRKLAGGGRPGHRAHMAQTTTKSYVRDFEVEIASASAVGNPVIGTARSGVVLDAHVAAVVTHHAKIALSYRRALASLAGSDPGANPRDWRDWMPSRFASESSRESLAESQPPVDATPEPATKPTTGGR